MAKKIEFDIEAREGIKRGVDALANAVKVTLGPKGRNVIIGKSFGAPQVTKDGVTVAKEIELKDNLENMGAQMVKEVASKTNDLAGAETTGARLEDLFQSGNEENSSTTSESHLTQSNDFDDETSSSFISGLFRNKANKEVEETEEKPQSPSISKSCKKSKSAICILVSAHSYVYQYRIDHPTCENPLIPCCGILDRYISIYVLTSFQLVFFYAFVLGYLP